MKITNIRTGYLAIPMAKVFKTALRTIDCVDCIVVVVETDTNHVGFGDCAPTAVITGDTFESIRGAIKHISQNLIGKEILAYEAVFSIIKNSMVGNTSAKAALDMAIYDLIGKHYQTPLYRFLGASRNELETDFTISIDKPEVMQAEAKEMVQKGFSILKTKVGGDIRKDIERLSGIRQAVGPNIKIRVDANQGWKAKEAVAAIQLLEAKGVNLDLIEQPVKRADFEGLAAVRQQVDVPVFADESVFSPEDALRLIQMDAVDGINIKLMKCGGIHEALKLASIAETANIDCMVGSMMEGPIGATAIAHFAMAKPVVRIVDLDAPLFLSQIPVKGGIQYENATIRLSDNPGLGVYDIEEKLKFD